MYEGCVCGRFCTREVYVVSVIWGACVCGRFYMTDSCGKFCMRDRGVVNFVWGKCIRSVLHERLACGRFCIRGIYVTRQIHEGEHSNCLYKTILQLSHLFQGEISLFPTRTFSKLNFIFSLTKHFKTYPSFVSTYNKIAIIY